VVIQPRPATGLVANIETEWFDQMQFSPGIGAHADDVAGVGRNFWLEEDNDKHWANFPAGKGAD
jgi:hypothetical protein